MWKHWVNVVLGLFVAVMPWLGLDAATHKWAMVVSGLVVAVLAGMAAMGDNKQAGM